MASRRKPLIDKRPGRGTRCRVYPASRIQTPGAGLHPAHSARSGRTTATAPLGHGVVEEIGDL